MREGRERCFRGGSRRRHALADVRPATGLQSIAARWRGAVSDPLFDVAVGWDSRSGPALRCRVVVGQGDDRFQVRIDLRADLSDDVAAHALRCMLAELQMLEVAIQCERLCRPCVESRAALRLASAPGVEIALAHWTPTTPRAMLFGLSHPCARWLASGPKRLRESGLTLFGLRYPCVGRRHDHRPPADG